MENQPQVLAQLPKYKCHKEVWALKIAGISPDGELEFEEEGYAPIVMEREWLSKNNAHAGGYYVVYKDGYKSFSPAEAFEDGYTKI